MEKEIIAYSAGVFDGEGTIYIRRGTNNNRKYYSLGARVTSTNNIITDWFVLHFGGTTKTESHRDNKPNWKPTLRWDVYGKSAEVFIKLLYPYLRLKLEHAQTAFNFINTENKEQKEHLYQSMRELNKRGL